MSALGSLVVKLALEHAEFTRGLDKSSQEALKFSKSSQDAFDKFERSAKSSISSVVKNVVGLGAAYLSVNSAISEFNSTVSDLAALDDLAQKTGASAEQLSRIQKVATAFGQDFSLVDNSLTKLAKGLGDLDNEGGKANTALEALNIKSRDLAGNLRDPAELLIEVAGRLQNYQDDASKAAVANDLFGKSGAELLPFLNDLSANIENYTGVSAEAISQAAAFEDNINKQKQRLGEYIDTLVIDALPALNDLFGAFSDIKTSSQALSEDKSILNWADNLALAVAPLYDVFRNLKDEIYAIGLSFKVVGADASVFGARLQLANPAAYLNGNPLGNLKTAQADRDRILAEANSAYNDLVGRSRSEFEDAVKARIAGRPNNYGSPSVSGASSRSRLNYSSDNGSSDATKAQREADQLYNQRLKDLQDEVTEEAETTDTINQYKSEKYKGFVDYKKKLENELNKKAEEIADAAEISQGKRIADLRKKEEDAIEENARLRERRADEFSLALTNGIFDSFRNGESFAKTFGNNLMALAKTWILRPTIDLFTNATGLSSLLGGSGTSSVGGLVPSGGGSGGFGSIFGSLKDIFTTSNASVVGSIENLGTFLSSGKGGLGDVLGGFLGENAAAIADGFGYFGSVLQLAQGNVAGALGTAVGTFFGGPIGGAIGSLLGGALGGLFGGGLPPRVTQSRTGIFSNGEFSTYEAIDPGKRKLGMAAPLDQLNEQFARNLNAIFSEFGIDSEISSNSLLTKKKNTRARFNATVNGEFLGQSELEFGKKGTFEQAFASLVERALGSYTVKAIQASDLPEGVKKFFDGLVKSEDVAATINGVVGLTKSLKDMPPVFDAIRNAIDTTLYNTPIAQLQQQFQAITTYTNLFYTQAENFATYTDQLNTQFDALNVAMPQTREGFRALVDGIDVVDKSTSDQFNALVGLAPAMDAYYKQLEQQKDIVEQTTGALRDLNSFTSLAEYRQYRGVANNYDATFALDNTANFRTGALGNNAAGQGVVTAIGSTEVVRLLQELRDYMARNVQSAIEQTDLLSSFDRIGIPTRA